MRRTALVSLLLVSITIFVFANQPVLADVTVQYFGAQWQQPPQISVTWVTAWEINNVGFNLLRGNSSGGPYSKVNASLIPSQCLGCIVGASYEYSDVSALPGQNYFYLLESVDAQGGRQIFGPVEAFLRRDLVYFFPLVSKQSAQPPGCNGTPHITSFSASNTMISLGQSTTLNWGNVTNADTVTIAPGIGGVGTPGSTTVSPSSTTTYTLTAYCGTNAATAQVTIEVLPP